MSIKSIKYSSLENSIAEQQVKKVDLSAGLIERKIHPDEIIPKNPSHIKGPKIICIGSSTGGVESLLTVFKEGSTGGIKERDFNFVAGTLTDLKNEDTW